MCWASLVSFLSEHITAGPGSICGTDMCVGALHYSTALRGKRKFEI